MRYNFNVPCFFIDSLFCLISAIIKKGNHFKCQEIAKSKVKVTLCMRVPCLPASLPLITFQFHLLVVSLSERYSPHPVLKGLTKQLIYVDGVQNFVWRNIRAFRIAIKSYTHDRESLSMKKDSKS